MGYEESLNEAYENIEPCESCERFEVKKVEGHHEGTRTIVTNFCSVADCIRRDCDHLAKFLLKSLATSGYVDGDRLIMDRKVSSKDINQRIERYIKDFVTCSGCKKPDTELVEEDGEMSVRCLACGAKKQVHKV